MLEDCVLIPTRSLTNFYQTTAHTLLFLSVLLEAKLKSYFFHHCAIELTELFYTWNIRLRISLRQKLAFPTDIASIKTTIQNLETNLENS